MYSLIRLRNKLPTSLSSQNVRTVTDIQYYREVDQSHLHLKEGHSPMRTFKLKLQKLEAKQKVQEDLKARMINEDGSVIQEDTNECQDEIQVPNYIQRSSTDILRAICKDIGRDYTAPDYRFKDDPFLIPTNYKEHRDYILSKEGGRKAARYILDKYPETFMNNRIEMCPEIKNFLPKTLYSKKGAGSKTLQIFIRGMNVRDSIKTYEALISRKRRINDDLKQQFLELLCYSNEEDIIGDSNEVFIESAGYTDTDPQWKQDCLAQKIYDSFETPTPEAKVALMCGFAKHNEAHKAFRLYNECLSDKIKFDINGYKGAILSLASLADFSEVQVKIYEILYSMKTNGVEPDEETLVFILKVISQLYHNKNSKNPKPIIMKFALSLIDEWKTINIEPCLGTYSYIFDMARFLNTDGPIILDKMWKEISSKEWNEVKSKEDTIFFEKALQSLVRLKKIDAVYKLNEFMEINNYDRIFLNEFHSRKLYYSHLISGILSLDSIDMAMKYYNRYIHNYFIPTNKLMSELLNRIEQEMQFQHLPKLWQDVVVSLFMGNSKKNIMFIGGMFLRTAQTIEPEFYPHLNEQELNNVCYSICSQMIDEIDRAPHDVLGYNKESIQKIEMIINISLRLEKFHIISDVLRIAKDYSDSLTRSISENIIMKIIQSGIKDKSPNQIDEKQRKLFIDCLIYSVDNLFSNTDEIGKLIKEGVQLSLADKKMLNQMFAYDSNWQVLK